MPENIIKAITPPPMRGIKQAIEELKRNDPNTALTEKALRRLILTGELPAVRVGKKYLVNMNNLFDYLGGKVFAVEKTGGGIRAVNE